ncbi:MAG: hypothetical protein Q4B80_04550 [Aerococcaceae bacterium]|nr:hypothetical protein [Aerococcaceae bacterium]
MKSTVEQVVPIEEIYVPEHYLEIPIPSWEAVVAPTLLQVSQQFNTQNDPSFVLLDEHVEALQLPNIETVHALKQFAMDTFKMRAIQTQFYSKLLPYLTVFYADTTSVILNSEELDAFKALYVSRAKEAAAERQESLEDYVKIVWNITEDIENQLLERATEDFIYKLIARHDYFAKGHQIDETAYERFILQQVLHQGADEITVREHLSYQQFAEIIPEMTYTQYLFDYFASQFKFVIDTHKERRNDV